METGAKVYTNTKILNSRAFKMRINPTPAEKIFAGRLLEAKINFKQQFVIEPYIADFVIGKTIIELDGSSHDGREVYDAKRDLYLRERKYKVIRILNKDAEKFDLSPFIHVKKIKAKKPKKKSDWKIFKAKRRQMQQDRFECEAEQFEMIQLPNGDFKRVKI